MAPGNLIETVVRNWPQLRSAWWALPRKSPAHSLSLVMKTIRSRRRIINANSVAAASGPTELLIIERGNHCVNNQRHKYSPQTVDWMAGHLSA